MHIMLTINDIALETISKELGVFDIEIDGADLKAAINLKTAFLISIITDARSTNEDPFPKQKGWVGDSLTPEGDDETGSRIWTRKNGKTTNRLLTDLEQFAITATQWMIKNEIAESISVEATFLSKPDGHVQLKFTAVEPGENDPQQFIYVWQQIKNEFRAE